MEIREEEHNIDKPLRHFKATGSICVISPSVGGLLILRTLRSAGYQVTPAVYQLFTPGISAHQAVISARLASPAPFHTLLQPLSARVINCHIIHKFSVVLLIKLYCSVVMVTS